MKRREFLINSVAGMTVLGTSLDLFANSVPTSIDATTSKKFSSVYLITGGERKIQVWLTKSPPILPLPIVPSILKVKEISHLSSRVFECGRLRDFIIGGHGYSSQDLSSVKQPKSAPKDFTLEVWDHLPGKPLQWKQTEYMLFTDVHWIKSWCSSGGDSGCCSTEVDFTFKRRVYIPPTNNQIIEVPPVTYPNLSLSHVINGEREWLSTKSYTNSKHS